MTGCKDLCITHKAGKPSKGKLRYKIGQKRCSHCDIFIWCKKLYCPCCGYKLQTKPRNSLGKRRMERG